MRILLSLLLPVGATQSLLYRLPSSDGLEPGLLSGINPFFLEVALVRLLLHSSKKWNSDSVHPSRCACASLNHQTEGVETNEGRADEERTR